MFEWLGISPVARATVPFVGSTSASRRIPLMPGPVFTTLGVEPVPPETVVVKGGKYIVLTAISWWNGLCPMKMPAVPANWLVTRDE